MDPEFREFLVGHFSEINGRFDEVIARFDRLEDALLLLAEGTVADAEVRTIQEALDREPTGVSFPPQSLAAK